ncbi:MBL fold metallo-hydrolase [Deltaproteobacteria bacterium]|nr:MBL fold metallo-hydrolase [Deltaproteobacteria bacterium]
MKIKFWGTRGSIPVPGKDTTIYGGNTTCLEITLDSGKTIIIDAGTGLRLLGEKLLKEKKNQDIHLLITHIHWDHVLGFPFFKPIYDASSKIYIDGNHNCLKGLKYTFDNKMGDGFFPIKFDDLRAEITYLEKLIKGPLEIDGTIIDSIQLHHPQGGLGFRLREGDKTLVFITDNELAGGAWEGRSPKEYARFCKGADILIHDSQYTPEEIDRRTGWGHSDYKAAFELAYNADVKKLILFHHDPPRSDVEVKEIEVLCGDLARKRKSDIIIEAAKENSELEL